MFTTLSLFFPVRNLFKQKREIKTKGKLSYLHMRRKGIIKNRNILPGKSDSSGSIITPSLVKTPFRCYVSPFFFFFWHQRNIKSLISPWLLRFHFCNLMSLWKKQNASCGILIPPFSFNLICQIVSLNSKNGCFSRSTPLNLRATYTK